MSAICRVVNFPEILAKTLEVITSITFIRIADIPGRRAKKKLFFLGIMHEVKAQRSEELLVKNMFILQHHLAVLNLETAD